jgi:hypothetical protein
LSLGYIGYCKKVSEDDATLFYSYSGANWNNPAQEKSNEKAYEGVFAIDKSVLDWIPSKPRKQSEGLEWAFSAIESGKAIVVTECKNAFYRGRDIDYIALRLFFHIFEYLNQSGELPDKEAFIQ